MCLAKRHWPLVFSGRGSYWIIFMAVPVALLLRVLRHKFGSGSLWSYSIVIPEWPHLMVVFCETVYLQWNITVLLLVPADAFRDLFLSNSHFWSRAEKVRVQDSNPDIELLTITSEFLLVSRSSRGQVVRLCLDDVVPLVPCVAGCVLDDLTWQSCCFALYRMQQSSDI